ncbi:MAG: Fur family transcriptional regulator [Vampirovibrionia bacterium]
MSEISNLKKTQKAVLDIIKDNCAINAYEIFEKINIDKEKKISQTTIYRALNYLEKNYYIKPINLLDGHTRYDAIQKKHNHHFICTNCKDILPISYCPLKESKTNFLPSEYEIKFHNFEIFGLCPKCKDIEITD